MIDFSSDRQFARGTAKVVASRQAKQSVQARQRDIYDSHRHRTFALAYYMTGSEIEAEQILTQTFVKAFSAAAEPSGQAVDSALVEELRQRSHLDRDGASAPPSEPELAGPADDIGNRNVRRTDLEEALRELPPDERILFLLRDVEGYGPATISELLKIPEPQVRRGLMAARIHLRRILAEGQADEEKAA